MAFLEYMSFKEPMSLENIVGFKNLCANSKMIFTDLCFLASLAICVKWRQVAKNDCFCYSLKNELLQNIQLKTIRFVNSVCTIFSL